MPAAGLPDSLVTLDKVDTIADGTRTDHATLFNFEMIQDKVDELCTRTTTISVRRWCC